MARMRVSVNGLQPLVFTAKVELENGEEASASLVYEKLERHCIKCHMLNHEAKDCLMGAAKGVNLRANQERYEVSEAQGQSQRAALSERRAQIKEPPHLSSSRRPSREDPSLMERSRHLSDSATSYHKYQERNHRVAYPVRYGFRDDASYSAYSRGERRHQSFYNLLTQDDMRTIDPLLPLHKLFGERKEKRRNRLTLYHDTLQRLLNLPDQ